MNTFTGGGSPDKWSPSKSTQGTVKARVLLAQYGDGYAQRSQDGINVGLTTWSNMFGPIPWSVLTAIDTFLRGQAGWQKFIWVPPAPYNDITRYFICSDWNWIYDDGQVISGLTANFIEVPGL
jgi:phage-related protein